LTRSKAISASDFFFAFGMYGMGAIYISE